MIEKVSAVLRWIKCYSIIKNTIQMYYHRTNFKFYSKNICNVE